MSSTIAMKTLKTLMTRLASLAAAVLCIAGFLASLTAHATSNCLGAGGTSVCTTAIYTAPASYSLCDDVAPNIGRVRAWCEVRGGTWDANIPGCVGTQADITPSSASGLAGAFEVYMHGAFCGSAPPPGACTNYSSPTTIP